MNCKPEKGGRRNSSNKHKNQEGCAGPPDPGSGGDLPLHGKGKPHTVSLPEKAGATLCGILKWDLTHCKESRGRAKFL